VLVKTTIPFDRRSTPIRLQFDRYEHSTTYVTTGLLYCGLNK